MTNPDEKLYDTLRAEQDEFREWLLKQPKEIILCHSYEFAIREDFLCAVENTEYPDEMAAALLDHGITLRKLYLAYGKRDTFSVFEDILDDFARAAYTLN